MPRLRDIRKEDLFGGGRKGDQRSSFAPTGPSQADLEEEIEKLEKEIHEIRSVYELYFMGVERTEPRPQRDALRARIRRLREVKFNNVMLKFRAQMIQARIVALENYWGRVARQREAGTYYRDVAKARRHEQERLEQEMKLAEAKASGRLNRLQQMRLEKEEAEKAEKEAAENPQGKQDPKQQKQQPGAPQQKNSRPPAAPSVVGRPAASSADDLTEPKLKQLYDAYVTAKRRCGEKLDLSFNDMSASLKKQVPKLIQTTGAKAIEFKVVIKQGKAVLKAVPKT